jgi:hypothetical protein
MKKASQQHIPNDAVPSWRERAASAVQGTIATLVEETRNTANDWNTLVDFWLEEETRRTSNNLPQNEDQRTEIERQIATRNSASSRQETTQESAAVSNVNAESSTPSTNRTGEEEEEENIHSISIARKAGVALAGGTLIAVGIPLIPLPGPGDFMVLGGMALLATEFPVAQRALDGTRQGLVEFLEKSEQEEVDDADDDDSIEDELLKEIQKTAKQSTKALKKYAETMGRNVILPLFDKVCTPDADADVAVVGGGSPQ